MSSMSRPRFASGERLGEWTLLDGGRFTDDVWRAVRDDGQAGVIKRVRGKKQRLTQRFAHEVRTLTKLQHLPGVLRLLDRDDAATPSWMVTELAVPLTDHLGPKPEFGTVVSAFADIAGTLTQAAYAGIAHRDIKPDNLFFANGRPLVGDFGLATGHDVPGLTGFGERIGPANFCAPEALAAKGGIDWHAADVFALVKSFWVAVTSQTYPPQGPLLISRSESDLTPYAGRAAEDLARLLELATLDEPAYRPHISEMRDELRAWLDLFPAGTPHRPHAGDYRTAYDEYMGHRAVDRAGRDGIANSAAQKLLDQCRSAGPDNGQVTEDSAADIAPREDPRQREDPEWFPDHVAIKKLTWDRVGGVRLVTVATLDGDDDLRYSISWQLRSPESGQWKVVWRADHQVRARLPSDAVERNRLANEALRNRPAAFDDAASRISGEAETSLRSVVSGIVGREMSRDREMDEARQRVASREDASSRARDALARLWNDFVDRVNSTVGSDVAVLANRDDNKWFLDLGDRRVVLIVANPPGHTGTALLLGTVSVQTQGTHPYKVDVANVCAIGDPADQPLLQLVRFGRNDLARPPAIVMESLVDGRGAVAIDVLDRLLNEIENPPLGMRNPAASLVSRDALTVDSLLLAVASELAAIEKQG